MTPMDANAFDRNRPAGHLDGRGDLAPPWERFPEYERYTIGWRMGGGEEWLHLWRAFLDALDAAPSARLAYLRRHPPAPVSWADAVHDVIHPDEPDPDAGGSDENDAAEAGRRADLLGDGLIASDAAYPVWLARQQGVRWPWEVAGTPEEAARHWTRELWFWSRQVAGLRAAPGWAPPPVPDSWRACEGPLRTGTVADPDPGRGLLTLARTLAAGRVVPPWRIGLTPAAFADTFEDDMGYVDAFRLLGMSAFDDQEHLDRYLAAEDPPGEWRRWVAEQFHAP